MDDAVAIARALGIRLTEWHLPEGTESTNRGRTWLATTDDGTEVVVKWSQDQGWGGWLPNVVGFGEDLAGRGYPCPRTLAHGPVGELGYGWVQTRVAGRPCTNGLTMSVVEEVLDAIELQAGASNIDPASEWSWVPAVVFDDHAGWWQAARAIDAETVLLCDRLESWVRSVERPRPRRDYVHLDLNFSNILAANGELTGIVDLDHMSVGDRSVDIACLAFQFEGLRFKTGIDMPDGVIDRLSDAARTISGEPGWRQAVAYNAIAWLGWSNAAGFRVPIDQAKVVVDRMIPVLT